MKKLTLLGMLIVSAALYAGHFGVGDVIFPMKLGQESGTSWFPSAIGYVVINSILALLAYMMIAKTGKNLVETTSDIMGRSFGVIYGSILMLIIGPIFILPRVSSATHEISIMPLFPQIPLIITLLIFFFLNAYVCLNPTKVVDRLGKILSPILIIFIVIVYVKGIATPISTPIETGLKVPFFHGFTYAYNTMNAIGAALFGGWMLVELTRRGIEKENQRWQLTKLGILVVIGLGITAFAEIYVGATTGEILKGASLGELPPKIVNLLFGNLGVVILAILMAFACFTTSVGLTSAAGHFFEDVTKGKLTYRALVILSSIVGFILGNVGLSKIVRWTVPWLFLTYPALIVIIIFVNLLDWRKFRYLIGGGVIGAVLFSIPDTLIQAGLGGKAMPALVSCLPFGGAGMGWVIPSIIGLIIGGIIYLASAPKPKSAT
ncbi:MAG: branched-chain amino acid transport system II carrier protein [Thermodesulfobacteriota bacterium]